VTYINNYNSKKADLFSRDMIFGSYCVLTCTIVISSYLLITNATNDVASWNCRDGKQYSRPRLIGCIQQKKLSKRFALIELYF